ncbi:MAG: hypothetical protein PHI64_20995, partial [Zoogloea sp.]|uniref:hypothetical protein n=1 Tax=Zoogloea sp. TaxID=49181 RepID=UPI002602D7AD
PAHLMGIKTGLGSQFREGSHEKSNSEGTGWRGFSAFCIGLLMVGSRFTRERRLLRQRLFATR